VARFDVYRFASSDAPLVLDVQADLLSDLRSRVVIPLVPLETAKNEQLPRLKPVLEIDGQRYVMMTTDLAGLPVARLGPFVENVESKYRDDITNALDFLLVGF